MDHENLFSQHRPFTDAAFNFAQSSGPDTISHRSNNSESLLLLNYNSSKPALQSSTSTTYAPTNGFWGKVRSSVVNVGRRVSKHTKSEEKKIVIEKTRKHAIIRCLIHLLPIAATIALAALNLKGYYIGSNFQGSSSAQHDTVDILALQVTSKLMELAIVASISRIVLDIIRYEALFGREGIPFGLLTVTTVFKDISTFFRLSFWFSGNAIKSRRLRLWLSGILILSGLLATFAGPSSALLMIPTIHPRWPAGGTSFWLVGSNSSHWPTKLDSTAVGGVSCLNPTSEMINNGAMNNSGCIWYSTSSVAQSFQNSHFARFTNMTITETTYKRTVGTFQGDGSYIDTWALSTNAAVGMLSDQLAKLWQDAVYHAPVTRTMLSSYHYFDYRIYEGTIIKVQTLLPAVRTRCNPFDNLSYSNTTALEFPVLPEYEESGDDTFILPITLVNSSSILTQWIPILEGMTTTSSGNQTSDYPSGFLMVQIPHTGSTTEFAIFACSVDARWALGHNIVTNVQDDAYPSDSLQHGEVISTVPLLPANRIAPIDDGTWSKISIDLDWLYTLTPPLDSSPDTELRTTPAWTSYASLLTDVGFDNYTSLLTNWGSIASSLEMTLATVVVEGLARIGFSENGGDLTSWASASSLLNVSPNRDEALDSLLKGGSNTLLPPNGVDPANLTKLYWGITISGYAYVADSIGTYIALAALFTYVALALGHTIYCLCTGHSSDAWDNFEDLLVLSHSSQPDPQALKNTSAGLRSYSTLQRKVRIRVADGDKRVPGQEELQLLFDTVSDGKDYKPLKVHKAYGVID